MIAIISETANIELIEKIHVKDLDILTDLFHQKNAFDADYLLMFYNTFQLKEKFKQRFQAIGKPEIEVYKKLKNRIDDPHYIFPTHPTYTYHNEFHCDFYLSEDSNYFYPDAILELKYKNQNKFLEVVDTLREWFKAKKFTRVKFDRDEDLDEIITEKFNAIFPEKFNIPKIEDFFQWSQLEEAEHYDRLRITEYVLDYDKFIDTVKEILQEREELLQALPNKKLLTYENLINKDEAHILAFLKDEHDHKIIPNQSLDQLKAIGLEKYNALLSKHRHLRNQSFTLILEYIRWIYNYPLANFREIHLDDYNIGRCPECSNWKTKIVENNRMNYKWG